MSSQTQQTHTKAQTARETAGNSKRQWLSLAGHGFYSMAFVTAPHLLKESGWNLHHSRKAMCAVECKGALCHPYGLQAPKSLSHL
eukprot:3006602-Amphidinium_carterae.1